MGSPPSEAHRADDEQPHPVILTRDFELMAHEVTQGEWERLMGFNPSRFVDCGEHCPVERVNWFEAAAFANARSREASLPTCYELSGCHGEPGEEDYRCSEVRFAGLACPGFRLPTEAEWEYAARAGSTGPTYGDIEQVAWHEDNSGHRTHPVGQAQPNAFGLYDMLGNVWEWTWDWYAPYPDRPATDPTGPPTGEERVLRGGSWNFPLRNVRAAHRNRLSPGIRGRNGSTGLRLARTLTTGSGPGLP
jgi:formylglycine-generating enzyme required for sulfatase activity